MFLFCLVFAMSIHYSVMMLVCRGPFALGIYKFAMSLCASVYMCFVVTCWERADLLVLVCGV